MRPAHVGERDGRVGKRIIWLDLVCGKRKWFRVGFGKQHPIAGPRIDEPARRLDDMQGIDGVGFQKAFLGVPRQIEDVREAAGGGQILRL